MTVRSILARIAAVTALLWVALGGASGVASAHAEFQTSRVNAGSTTSVTLDVPDERSPDVYTTVVRVQVPAGWTAPSCTSPTGWDCSAMPEEIAFSKDDPTSITNASEAFTFSLTAPATPGTTVFPVVQIYSTGENVLWSNSAQLQVVAAPGPTTPPPGPSTTLGPTTTLAPTTTTRASSTTATPSTTAGATDDASATKKGSSSGGGVMIAVIVAVVVLGAGAGTAVVLRRRNR